MKKVSKRTFKESEVKEHIVTFCFEPRMVISCNNFGEEDWIDDGFVWEDIGQRTIDDAINSLLKQDEAEGCDLAKYVDDNLKGLVKTIKMEWQSHRDELLLVHCTLTTEPTEQIIEDLKEYLEGQMANGWGEGFEQQELASSSYIVVANENDTNGYDEMFFFDKSQWRYAEAKAEEMNEAANGDEDEDEDDTYADSSDKEYWSTYDSSCSVYYTFWNRYGSQIRAVLIDGRDAEGFDIDGRDREGYDRFGRDKDGFNKKGYKRDFYGVERDRDGYDEKGFDSNGKDREGFDKSGHKDLGNKRPTNKAGKEQGAIFQTDKNGKVTIKNTFDMGESRKRKSNLKEAVFSDDIQKIVNMISEKDWYRAATVKSSARLDSTMDKVTDPKKLIGRTAALFLLKVIDSEKAEMYLKDNFDAIAYKVDNTAWGRDENGVSITRDEKRADAFCKKYPHGYSGFRDYDDVVGRDDDYVKIEAFLAAEFPEYSETDVEPEDFVVTTLMDIDWEELKDLPSLKSAIEKFPEVAQKAKSVFGSSWKDAYRKWYDDNKSRWDDDQEYYGKKLDAKKSFGGQKIFEYILDADAIVNSEVDKDYPLEKILELIQGTCSGSDLSHDSDHIIPPPMLQYMRYKSNFVEWLKAKGIKVRAPQYWNSYHYNDEFAYADDDSAWNAGALRNDPVFQKLVKVTRSGVSFTRAGAYKYWYDCTKDIAEHFGFEFGCKEIF